jgi:hypothetical protein
VSLDLRICNCEATADVHADIEHSFQHQLPQGLSPRDANPNAETVRIQTHSS